MNRLFQRVWGYLTTPKFIIPNYITTSQTINFRLIKRDYAVTNQDTLLPEHIRMRETSQSHIKQIVSSRAGMNAAW